MTDTRKEKEEYALTIRSQIERAFQDGKMINIFASGTYKGVTGKVVGFRHGSLTLSCETEDGQKYTTTMRVVDIKRVSVFE